MKVLTDEERSEIQEAEEARSVNLMYHHVQSVNCDQLLDNIY